MFVVRRVNLLGVGLYYGLIIFARSQTITDTSLPKSDYLTSTTPMGSTDVQRETATNNLTSIELTTYRSTEKEKITWGPIQKWPPWFYGVIDKVNISDTEEFFTSVAYFQNKICKYECGDSYEYMDYDK